MANAPARTDLLCDTGQPSRVSGTGPWTWTCVGTDGVPVSCVAYKYSTPANGSCGPANGTTVSVAPTTNLCSVGTASTVSGTGPWTWTCAGMQGGTTASCSANKSSGGGGGTPVNGTCGSANGTTVSTAPTTNLCSAGTASTVSGTGPWTWTCAGSNGGSTASCSANKSGSGGGGGSGTLLVNGSCGNAARNYTESETAFSGSFCYTGIPEPVNPTFPTVSTPSTWKCLGMTGGTSGQRGSDASCTATLGSGGGGGGGGGNPPGTCSLYTTGTAIPAGYGSPFNQLSSAKEPLLSVACSDTGAVITAGSQNTSTYKTGFVARNGAWEKVDFSGASMSNNTGWFQGSALATAPDPGTGVNYAIAFICQYQNGAWKCGCRDSACAQNYWTLQSYKK